MFENGGGNLQERVVRQIKAEPVKAAVLGVLLAAMGGLWFKAASSGGGLPSLALGRSLGNAPVALPSRPDNHSARALKQLGEWVKTPVPTVTQNLFALKFDYFPTDGSRPAQKARVGSSFWEELGKSIASKADQEKARRILIDNVRLHASRLELQSTVMNSGSPKALVNGTLVGEGDAIAGFKIVKIEARRIVVEREGVRVEVAFGFTK
jgi:hypothetical protein